MLELPEDPEEPERLELPERRRRLELLLRLLLMLAPERDCRDPLLCGFPRWLLRLELRLVRFAIL